EHLADVALAVPDDLPEPPGEFDRLLLGPRLDQREADDDFLGLGERSISQRDISAGSCDVGATVQATRGQQYPGPGHFLDESPHLGEKLLVRRSAAAVDRHQEAHRKNLRQNPGPCPSSLSPFEALATGRASGARPPLQRIGESTM